MKKSTLYFSFIFLPFAFSCNQGNHKDSKLTDSLSKAKIDKVLSTQCFMAVDGKDTADLKINTLSAGKITGNLTIRYIDKGKNDGTIEGKFKNDTLFVDYTFKIGTENPTVYKNPLALLKKDSTLVLGVGQIETFLGKSYFAKGKPINFEKGRFTFAPVACKE